MADDRTRWRDDRSRWEREDYGREAGGSEWGRPERGERPAWGYGYEDRAGEGYDYGRDYWRQEDRDEGRAWRGDRARDMYRSRDMFGDDRPRGYWRRGEGIMGGGRYVPEWERERERGGGDYWSGPGYGGMRGRESWGGRYGADYGHRPYAAGAGGGYRGYSGRGEGWAGQREDYGMRGEERGWFDRAADEVSSWFGDDEAERRRQMDERRSGGQTWHRGRGPRGYVRSDERIREDVNDRLTDDPVVDASDIEVSVSGCEVTLNGTVEHRMAKRRAEDIAESVSGVKHVQNNLRVKEHQMASSGASSGGAGSTLGTTENARATAEEAGIGRRTK